MLINPGSHQPFRGKKFDRAREYLPPSNQFGKSVQQNWVQARFPLKITTINSRIVKEDKLIQINLPSQPCKQQNDARPNFHRAVVQVL